MRAAEFASITLNKYRRMIAVAGQLLVCGLSNYLAFLIRFDGNIPIDQRFVFLRSVGWLLIVRAASMWLFNLYQGLWRYTSIYDLRALVSGVLTGTVLFVIVNETLLRSVPYPLSVLIIDTMALIFMLGGLRLCRRILLDFPRKPSGKRVLVYGAGDAGELVVRDMKSTRPNAYNPIGFIDDDEEKVGLRIHRVPVLGTRYDLASILKTHRPDEVLIAIPAAKTAAIRSIVRALEPFKVAIKTLPNLRDIIDGKIAVSQIRSLSVEDLLSRAPVGLDTIPVRRLIEGRRVMVTGAGGSIGSELCRQIAELRPATLVMFERYENTLHAIEIELRDRKFTFGLQTIVGDVTDAARIAEVLTRHRPEIIFHAAAHKHVPLMEYNPCEAIKNNVHGTRILAQAAEAYGVDRFILISTDKAVNPTSVMGASKRVCELVVQAQAVGSGTSFSIVRFGNVLGSNGSVVPRFIEQIKRGGPVTVTHPEMKRFFMLIPEAVQLVLHAAAQAESGVTYVLEMGDQVKLVDMARDLIRLSGLAPDEDIKLVFTGLRPGEKLFEELVGPDEESTASRAPEILCVRSRKRPSVTLMNEVQRLEAYAAEGRADAVRVQLAQLAGFASPDTRLTVRVSEHRAHPAALAPSPVQVPSRLPEPALALAFVHARDEQPCPKCREGRARRSRARAFHERTYKQFTDRRPFRCLACGWRGWLVPLQFGEGSHASVDTAVDLSCLDRHIAPEPGSTKPAFSPRNLS